MEIVNFKLAVQDGRRLEIMTQFSYHLTSSSRHLKGKDLGCIILHSPIYIVGALMLLKH